MNKKMILLINLFFMVCPALTENNKKHFFEFSATDFKAKLREYPTAVVMFYSPGCAHCIEFKPVFAKVAVELKEYDPPLTFIKFDCTKPDANEICQKYKVTAYPTISTFEYGIFLNEYNGRRRSKNLIEHLKGLTTPISTEITTLSELEDLVKNNDEVVVVGFFNITLSKKIKNAYLKASTRFKDTAITFVHTSSPEILNEYEMHKNVIMFQPKYLENNFETRRNTYFGKPIASDIYSFIQKNYHGIVGHRKRNNAELFSYPIILVYYLVDYVKNPKGTNYWRNRILQVATNYRGKIKFAICRVDDFLHELDHAGVDDIRGDPIVIGWETDEKNVVMKDKFSVKALNKFVDEYLRTVLSGPILNHKSEVKVAVAKNFDEMILKSENDTLINFCVPSNKQCKELEEVFEQLAVKLKDEFISIAKMDASTNYVPISFEVMDYPTIFWVPSGFPPVRYTGSNKLQALLKFICISTSKDLKGYERNGSPKFVKTEL